MSRRTPVPLELQIAASGIESLERREALYIRLLLSQPTRSRITEQLYYRLTQVRLALFAEGRS
jgi:hypothetical protein